MTKLLIVDDQQELREVLAILLGELGCSILEASSGNAAFTLVERERPDFVLTDVRMSDGNGIELIENINTLATPRPAVAAMSGFADISLQEILNRGAVDLFDKPFNASVMAARIKTFFMPWDQRWPGIVGTWPQNLRRFAFNSVTEAIASGDVAIGTGGLFVATANKFPLNEHLQVRLTFGANVWSMAARVRWSREAETPFFHAGVGLEIVDADGETRQALQTLIETQDVRAFVPIGVRSRRS